MPIIVGPRVTTLSELESHNKTRVNNSQLCSQRMGPQRVPTASRFTKPAVHQIPRHLVHQMSRDWCSLYQEPDVKRVRPDTQQACTIQCKVVSALKSLKPLTCHILDDGQCPSKHMTELWGSSLLVIWQVSWTGCKTTHFNHIWTCTKMVSTLWTAATMTYHTGHHRFNLIERNALSLVTLTLCTCIRERQFSSQMVRPVWTRTPEDALPRSFNQRYATCQHPWSSASCVRGRAQSFQRSPDIHSFFIKTLAKTNSPHAHSNISLWAACSHEVVFVVLHACILCC